MPVPLNTDVRTYFDSSVIPPNASQPSWPKDWIEKSGMRWAVGDEKYQILPYYGNISRGKSVHVASDPALGLGYYAPSHPYGKFSGNDWRLNAVPSYGVATVNKAYSRFVDVALGESASWGTTIAEGREALEMIGDRAIRLRRAYKNLRRGEFRDFLRELSVKPKRKHKSVLRTSAGEASGLWLEYWFGWSPLAGEIYQSTIALTAAKTEGSHFATAWRGLDGSESGPGTLRTETGKYFVKIGANVRYDNQDVMLATQMGLTNPLAIAWELVPFSFVVDWFTGVGNVLGARSDFYGTTVSKGYNTQYLKTVVRFHTWDYYFGGDPVSTRYIVEYKNRLMKRRLGIITPIATYPKVANFGDSSTRAATAVSLLVQMFLDK